jgi:isopentenyl-diphosphate delta-isomerase
MPHDGTVLQTNSPAARDLRIACVRASADETRRDPGYPGRRRRGGLRSPGRGGSTIQAPGDDAARAGADDLILVDASDRVVGYLDKERCHDGAGRLHRAFSIFLRDAGGRVVLQQRSAGKRLWAGRWSNSVCSHPRRGETLEAAAQRRLREELGVAVPLRFLFRFEYQASCAAGSEHELCSVFWGTLAGEALRPDPGEIAAIRRVAPDALTRELRDDPDAFTPWLHLEWRRLRDEHATLLGS